MIADPSIHTIDTGFQRPDFDAAYLIVQNDRAAFVDCGTGLSVPAMLQALANAGLAVDAVDWLLLTHVHLDHAGGAGLLMQQLPNAKAVLHPRGAPHMIDPTRLIAGATAVYGAEEIARSYGRIEAIPEHRVVVAEDGHRIDLAGRELVCCTPRATHCTITACGMRAAAAGSPAIPSAFPTASWTARRGPSSSRPRRRCSSTRKR
ncbi:beta-lactamase protein [Stenotrophomonas maltophilia WJ66]|nr:beta-lactamase protein [Stenotrophomonas maltophilia WJ66]